MKLYNYLLSTNTIRASFDGGQVTAEDVSEALRKAKDILSLQLEQVNAVLAGNPQTEGHIISMDMDQIEIKEAEPNSIFKELRTDHVDDNGVTSIDGWMTGKDDEEGTVLGYFITGEVYWTDPDYQFDPLVKEVIKELKAQ